jgi:hypothetical protein
VAAVCALTGAAAGISQSSGASSSAKKTTGHSAAAPAGMPGHPGHGGPGGPHGMAVHSVEVVLNKAGTAYISETTDSGTITAVDTSAGTITLKEGTSSVTYGTPTITIPSGASVTLDGTASSLGKLTAGDRVDIRSSSEGTTVLRPTRRSNRAAGPEGLGWAAHRRPAPPPARKRDERPGQEGPQGRGAPRPAARDRAPRRVAGIARCGRDGAFPSPLLI